MHHPHVFHQLSPIQWSYAVTMWEIFTCGRVPYAGIHAMCLLTELKRGERLEKPDNKACHDDMYGFNIYLSISDSYVTIFLSTSHTLTKISTSNSGCAKGFVHT